MQRNHQGRGAARRSGGGARALAAAGLLLSFAFAGAPDLRAQNSGGAYQDEFQTQGNPDSGGGDSFSTGDLPGGEGGGPCEDTSKYDRIYGGPPVRIALKALHDPLYQRHPDILMRCAVDRCAVNETAICWINKEALAKARQDPAVSDEYETQSDEGDDSYGCPADPAWTAEQQAWWNKTYCTGVGNGGSGGGGSGAGGTTSASNTPPEGSKSIYRQDSNPDPSGRFTADIRSILGAMDDCLRVKGGLGFYRSPSYAPGGRLIGYDPASRTVSFGVGALKDLSLRQQAMALGGGMGQHVLSLEEQRYGQTRTPWENLLVVDYVAGYLSHCIERRGLIPSPTNDDNVPEEFEIFLLQNSSIEMTAPQRAERRQSFNEGWGAWGARLPNWLTHN